MTPETIRALATEIVNQTILSNWLFYVVLACITVVLTAIGSSLSSFFSKRAEHAALTADFDELKNQLRETTSLSESIKIDITQLAERSERLQWLKREKLEAYVVAVLRGAEHLSIDVRHKLTDAEPPTNEDPLIVASMIQALYLPELDEQHAVLLKTVAEFRGWIAKGMQERLDSWKATSVKKAASNQILDQYPYYLDKLNSAVMLVEQAAKELARELNKI
jgi:hypothetical protein